MQDGSFRSNQVSVSSCPVSSEIIAGPVSLADFSGRIGQEWKWEPVLVGEGSVRLNGVGTYAQDLDLQAFKFLDSIPESYPFGYSTGGIRPGVKPKDNSFAAVVA